jgi:hypothetical protein
LGFMGSINCRGYGGYASEQQLERCKSRSGVPCSVIRVGRETNPMVPVRLCKDASHNACAEVSSDYFPHSLIDDSHHNYTDVLYYECIYHLQY